MTDQKECPGCHARVPQHRTICPSCGRRFDIEELKAKAAEDSRRAAPVFAVGCFLSAVLLGVLLYSCVRETPAEKAQRLAEEAAASAQRAEDHRKGFDCLSAWDGSNASLVEQVKRQLRDPDSFEHDETRIAPADNKGQHVTTMRYRARNGFGGMNVGTAMAVIDGTTCQATVISVDE